MHGLSLAGGSQRIGGRENESSTSVLPIRQSHSRSDEYTAVVAKHAGRVIGDLFAVPCEQSDTFSLGWNFNADFGGAGFAFEASRALVDHLFAARDVRRLYAYVEDDNIGLAAFVRETGNAARRSVQGVRVVREGRFRRSDLCQYDSVRHSAEGVGKVTCSRRGLPKSSPRGFRSCHLCGFFVVYAWLAFCLWPRWRRWCWPSSVFAAWAPSRKSAGHPAPLAHRPSVLRSSALASRNTAGPNFVRIWFATLPA